MSNINCILYPPTLDLNYLVQRPQQLLKGFSELGHTVYYLNRPGPNSMEIEEVRQITPNFYLFNNADPKPYLKDIRPVVYFSATAHVDIIAGYNPSLVVFDSLDEPSDEFESWRPYYHQAVSRSDIVIATSEKLYNMAVNINPNTYLVPNGCDYDYFSQASIKAFPVPEDLAGISGPIIGYIGVIASWVDIDLILATAERYSDCQLVVVGPLYNISDVPRRENIHYLGFKPYSQLAAYAQQFDVGIIPFKKSSMIESVNPIKMWEYMAAGLPIVATAMPETLRYNDLILCSHNKEEFLYNIETALYYDSPEKRARRLQFAQENTWLVRAQQVIEIIENHLNLSAGLTNFNYNLPQSFFRTPARPSAPSHHPIMYAGHGGRCRTKIRVTGAAMFHVKSRPGVCNFPSSNPGICHNSKLSHGECSGNCSSHHPPLFPKPLLRSKSLGHRIRRGKMPRISKTINTVRARQSRRVRRPSRPIMRTSYYGQASR